MKKNNFVVLTLILASFILGYFIGGFKIPVSLETDSSAPNSTLHVLVLGPESEPVDSLEVDLWKDSEISGPPTAGVSHTNLSGIAVFSMPKGGYIIGFNLLNFPETFEVPMETPVSISEDFNNITINLHNKIE